MVTLVKVQKLGRMTVVGTSIRTDARGVVQNVTMTITVLTAWDGTMDSIIVRRDKADKDHLSRTKTKPIVFLLSMIKSNYANHYPCC